MALLSNRVMNAYMPQVRVVLEKSIVRPDRQYTGFGVRPGQSLDITQWLGDSGYVVTSKDLYAPTGIFEIAFPDTYQTQPSAGLPVPLPPIETIYELLEPMDQIKIYFARNRHEYPGNTLPIIMRGWIRDIQRTEVMGDDGKPRRRVLVRGSDYGLFGELAIISYWRASAMGRGYVPQILQESFGLRTGGMTIKDFVDDVLESLINQQIRDLNFATGQQVPIILPDTDRVTAGAVHINAANSHDGSAWSYLHRYVNTPWNELYVEDRQDAAYLVFRPTPWRDLNGQWIPNLGSITNQQGQTVSVNQALSAVEVIDTFDFVKSANYRRTEHDVVNLVWAPWTSTSVSPMAVYANLLLTANPIIDFGDHFNSQRNLYGFRMLQHPVQTVPDLGTHKENLHISTYRPTADSLIDWSLLHSLWLQNANKDNVLFEEGEMTVRGNERAKIGTYYTLGRGQLRFTHYLTRVTHQFRPFHSFLTTLGFIRSTNFWERLKAPRPPFFLEGHKGAYANQ